MPDNRQLTTAVRRALKTAPVGLQEVARRARVSRVQLWRLTVGDRSATTEVAQAVLGALDSVGDDCAAAAKLIRRALTHHKEEE